MSKRNVRLSALSVFPQSFGDIDTYCNNALCHVKSLTVGGDLYNSKDCVLNLLENCTRLETFRALNCSGLTNDIVISLANNCHRLNEVDFSGGGSYQFVLSDPALIYLGSKCPDLLVLRLSLFAAVSDEGIEHIVRHCPDLTELSLSHMFSVTDISLAHIGHHCRQLRVLVIFNDKASRRLPAHSVKLPLLTQCTQLTTLTLSGYVVTDTFAQSLLNRCTLLTALNLKGCAFSGCDPVFEASLRGFTEVEERMDVDMIIVAERSQTKEKVVVDLT
jgi:hypothetical protein